MAMLPATICYFGTMETELERLEVLSVFRGMRTSKITFSTMTEKQIYPDKNFCVYLGIVHCTSPHLQDYKHLNFGSWSSTGVNIRSNPVHR